MSADCLTILSRSPDDTCRLAREFEGFLMPGDVLLLSGDVGAGKTHFARCLIQAALADPEDVPSPTYTLIQTYETPVGDIWHADLYRLSDTSEIEELGLHQAFAEAICLVEWPDRLGDMAPSCALMLEFSPGADDDARNIRLRWTDETWNTRLKGLADV